jgi:uncharacterized protein
MKTVLKNSGLRLLVAIIFFSGALHAQEKKSEKALLWKVSGNGLKESSYLFGTYHLLGSKFLAEVPETAQPFANAKGVVVELVVDSAKMASVMMSKAVMYDKKISTLLSAEDFKRVDSVLQSLSQYNLKMFDMFKPIQVSIMISLLQTQKENAELLKKYDGTALDIHFASEGKKLGKTVTPLETMEQQFDMLFNHFTVEEQAQQLVEAVKKSDLTSKFSVDMTNAYLKKDIDVLMKMIEEAPKEITGGSMDHMLKDRNENWVKVLPALMKSGSQFIAVGAGHLPGKDGLITLLQKQGYTVVPVTK